MYKQIVEKQLCLLRSVHCGEQVTKFICGEMKSPAKKPAKEKPAKIGKVIIVGAGPAGLAAANHLKVYARIKRPFRTQLPS